MDLNSATPAQSEAITTDKTNVIVVAGPGSGKSSTVVARIMRRINDVKIPAKEMVVLSFTNAAANELARRLPKIEVPKGTVIAKPNGAEVNGISYSQIELGFIGTLHSFALRMLKEHGAPFGYGQRTAIIAPDSAEDLMASKATTLGCKTPIEKLLKAKAAYGRPPRGIRLSLDQTVIATYLDELREAKVVDYDVLLHEFLEMLTSSEPRALSAQQSLAGIYSDLYVDECQDSSPIQWAIYRALQILNKFYVGDPDQNLYEWNGARVREMIDEAAKPDTLVVKLEENFRSKIEICAAAQRLIVHNGNRVDKETKSVNGVGGIVERLGEFENEGEEVAAVAKKIKRIYDEWDEDMGGSVLPEVAIIARTNAIAFGFRQSLPTLGIKLVEQKKYELPKDWPLARALIEIQIDPENDSLAYFYLVAKGLNSGLSNKDARTGAQKLRVMANAKANTINGEFLKMSPITRPESAIESLRGAGISRESYMIAVEKFRELPPGATLDEFALSLGSLKDYTKEEPGDGVQVLSIHGSKGKEFDMVFFVGMEDQTIPGQAAAKGDDAIEGERRCAYVAMTRARSELYLSSVKSRVSSWKEVLARRASRFFDEIQPNETLILR